MAFFQTKNFGASRFRSLVALLAVAACGVVFLTGCEQKPKVNKERAKKYFSAAKTYDENGKYKQALENYTNAIAENPGYKQAYLRRAMLHENQGEKDKAIKDFRKVAKLDKDDMYCRSRLVNLYREKGNHEMVRKYEAEEEACQQRKMSQTRDRNTESKDKGKKKARR